MNAALREELRAIFWKDQFEQGRHEWLVEQAQIHTADELCKAIRQFKKMHNLEMVEVTREILRLKLGSAAKYLRIP